MKKIALCLAAAALLALLPLAPAAADSAEDAVRETVERGYVRGIQIEGDPELIRSGFHKDFVMLVRTDEGLRQVTRDGWIERIERGKAENPDAKRPKVDHSFTLVDVNDDVAVARVEIHHDGTHVYTDYLTLYRFDDDWKIVGKVFTVHDD